MTLSKEIKRSYPRRDCVPVINIVIDDCNMDLGLSTNKSLVLFDNSFRVIGPFLTR